MAKSRSRKAPAHSGGESALIASFGRAIDAAGVRPAGLVLGVGDDAAVFRGDGEDYVVTKDALVEGRHFQRRWFSGKALGWRAAAVNLSDVAAMGARARFALVSLLVPEAVAMSYVRGVERGIVENCARAGAAVIGGNISATGGPLVVDVTMIGACARGRAWRRKARKGDAIVAIGSLGDAAAGLAMLAHDAHARGKLVGAYKRPPARLDVARLLAGERAVHAAIDVSDGLSTDVIHMCRAGEVGCELDASRLPVSRALRSYCMVNDADPVDWVLRGGEDYALLLGVSAGRAEAICARVETTLGVAARVIGRFAGPRGRYRLIGAGGRTRAFRATGWDHLAAR